MSFEIMFRNETSERFKKVEREAAGGVAFWITQDEVRAQKLQIENGLKADNLFVLPVSSKSPRFATGARLRDKLKIPIDKKVAIAIGSISTWTMIDEIVHALPSWSEEWVLLIHDRYGATEKNLCHLNIDLTSGLRERLYISTSASDDVENLDFVFGGIDCGLAFYKSVVGNPLLGDNIRFIGKSSGKISTYFRYGIPVITNINGPLGNSIKANKLGDVIESPGMLPERLSVGDISGMSENCHNFFRQELDFDIYADRLWGVIEQSSFRGALDSAHDALASPSHCKKI